jgi:hypothetical protein
MKQVLPPKSNKIVVPAPERSKVRVEFFRPTKVKPSAKNYNRRWRSED